MTEIQLDRRVHRHRGGTEIACRALLQGDSLTVSCNVTDALCCRRRVMPFQIHRQEIASVRLRPALLVNSTEMILLLYPIVIPLGGWLIAAWKTPEMSGALVPLFAILGILTAALFLPVLTGWTLEFTAEDGRKLLMPVMLWLLPPFERAEREPLLAFIKEVRLWNKR